MVEAKVQLTLQLPRPQVPALVDLLLAMDPPLPPFSLHDVEVGGMDFRTASAAERVAGMRFRAECVLVLTPPDATRVLDHLVREFAGRGVSWRQFTLEGQGDIA